jgi:hypothetical protein
VMVGNDKDDDKSDRDVDVIEDYGDVTVDGRQ